MTQGIRLRRHFTQKSQIIILIIYVFHWRIQRIGRPPSWIFKIKISNGRYTLFEYTEYSTSKLPITTTKQKPRAF